MAGQEESRERCKLVPVSPHDKAHVNQNDRGLSQSQTEIEDAGLSREGSTESGEEDESAGEEGRK